MPERAANRQAARPGATAGSAHSIARYAAFSRFAPGSWAPHMDHRLIGSSAPSVAWMRVVSGVGPPAPGHAAPALGRALRLPGERNGLMIVFRVFERVSYALLLQITDGVKIGDRFITP